MNKKSIALVGNPNCGKTTLFNALTGGHQYVGNWSGVTVAQERGVYHFGAVEHEIIDLPGCYSCGPWQNESETGPLDEHITYQYLSSRQAELIVNIMDATQLERHLYLTLELIEQGFPVIIALNMMDVIQQAGVVIDCSALAIALGCPVIALSAAKEQGIIELKTAIANFDFTRKVLPIPCVDAKAFDMAAAKARALHAKRVAQRVTHQTVNSHKISITEKIDKIVLNRFLGIPIFLGLMYLMFVCTIHLGGILKDFFDIASKTLFVESVAKGLWYLNAPDWVHGFLAEGVGQGINTTVTFIPIIAAMFFCLSFLEASGYMARAAFVMDKVMQWVGLPGKSFVPMIIGFGCNVPAILATRTLENYRDRVLTVLMSPFMSCGARLVIYALFVSAFFPEGGQNIIFGLYLIGILVAFLTGFFLRTTLLPGERSTLIMELPQYRWPSLKVLWRTTLHRVKQFILKAGALIIPLCIIIGTFGALETEGEMWVETLGRKITPVFAPMGIQEDNWPATVGLLTGVLAKEVVVGTLNALYIQEGGLNGQGNELDEGVLGVMVARFGSTASAFAYLLFILLYFPCVSVVATLARELNKKWAVFSLAWTTGIAYSVAVLFYQSATFLVHPSASLGWIIGLTLFIVSGGFLLRGFVQRRTTKYDKSAAGKLRKPLPVQIKVSTIALN